MIRNNRIHGNGRAGIAALAAAVGNTLESNDATGNGLLNLGPSLLFDLFDAPPVNNTWLNNQGRSNFATGSALLPASSAVVGEAFSEGGCLAGEPRLVGS